MNTLMHIHKLPVERIRFSTLYPKLLVSSGKDADTSLKVFNIGAKHSDDPKNPAESLSVTTTSSLRHKVMA